MRMSVEEFADLCRKIYRKYGFNEEEIEACTEEIVEAQCTGRLSHGAAFIPRIELSGLKKEKAGIIEILKLYLTNFEHIETGKQLDSKM